MLVGDSSFCQYKVYANIRAGSLKTGRQTTVGCLKGDFHAGYIFGTFRDKADIIHSDMKSLVALTLSGYFTLNCVLCQYVELGRLWLSKTIQHAN